MTRKRHHLNRRRDTERRPTDVGKTLARSLIIRALRHADLHHVLHGRPCIVGFVVPDPDDRSIFLEAGRSILRTFAGQMIENEYEVFELESISLKQAKKSEANVRRILMENSQVFAFAADPGAFPSVFRLSADAIMTPDPVDPHALRGALQAVLGRVFPAAVLTTASRLPLPTLAAAIKPGRSIGQTIRRLERVGQDKEPAPAGRSARHDEPTLDDLHGLGEAAEWGRSLAQDLADYVAGRLPWSEVDRGILVSGPTGTGKTTFARALARSCKVPIHIHSLARWQAKGYLNDLLKAMRGAFDEARKDAPCILFIDEIDSFGDRETLTGHNEQYCREVINAFLECLDGVDAREGVVVVGATNLPGKIDAAIVRPGRLDRRVEIPLPDLEGRKGILRHHLRDALPAVDLTAAAERLEGASGAVIEQVVRDARRKARTERREIALNDLHASLPARVRLPDEAFRRACVHEAGHAVVGVLLANESGRTPTEVRVFREVAIGASAAGHTAYRRHVGAVRTRSAYLAEITSLLAGLAAEEIVIGSRGDGGGGSDGSDLQRATVLATAMEVSLGLGGTLAYLAPNDGEELLARLQADASLRRAVDGTLGSCLERARTLLLGNRTALDELADVLKARGRAMPDDILGILACADRRGDGIKD